MAEPELDKTDDRLIPATATLVATNSTSQASNANAEPVSEDKVAHDGLSKAAPCLEPRDYFTETLNGAQRLLKYAAETGTDVNDDVRNHILKGMTVGNNGWTEEMAANLLTAATKLAAQLKPVTPESLKCTKRLAVRFIPICGWPFV